ASHSAAQYSSFDPSRGALNIGMFPKAQNEPAVLFQECVSTSVTQNMPLNLGSPPRGVVFWPSCVLWTCVPKTAVNEYRNLHSNERYVGPSPCTSDRPIHSETQATSS